MHIARAMKSILPVLTLVSASSAFAQSSPSVAKKSALQHSVEASYVATSSNQQGLDDLSGFGLGAKAYVWQNVFIALEYVDVGADAVVATPGGPVDTTVDISRLGYGIGATFQFGFGQLDVSYTYGQVDVEIPGVFGNFEIDQGRLNATVSHTYANGVSAALGVTQYFNSGDFSWDDSTAFILTVGYDFKNGLSVFASYSPDSAAIGDDVTSEDTFALGAKYSF